MTNIQHPFLPGTPVLTKFFGAQRWVKDKVVKLHKTGTFTLENQRGHQFKAYERYKDGNKSHWEGVSTHYLYDDYPVLLWTDDLQAEKFEENAQKDRCDEVAREATRRYCEAKSLLRRLSNVDPWHFDDTQLSALRALVAMFGEASS